MEPVMCEVVHDPENGMYGDCFRACIASILELTSKEVPHFYSNWIEGTDFNEHWKGVRKWFNDNNILIFEWWSEDDLRHYMLETNPDIYYIFTGGSSIDANHAVVCLNNEIVHDPSGNGIIGSTVDNQTYGITILGVPESIYKETPSVV